MPDVAALRRVSFEHLTLHYQPQIASDGSRIVSVEALLRVSQPIPRLVTPADVLALFDAPEDAAALDWWVLRRACADAMRWPTISVSINLTAARFREPGLADRVMAVLDEIGLDPTRIELEIVESAYIADFDSALANIVALRAEGIRVALDDFGTGYSSLTYLLQLPFDKIKIDKSFVDGIGTYRSAAILHAIVALGRALGMKITAEGVETEEQYRFLRAAGCHLIQGWLFAKAVAPETIDRLLTVGEVPRGLTD